VRKPTVLAVDDDHGNLLAVEATLSPQFEVITAGSAHAAIEIVRSRNDIDVILMDIQMPDMDGFEAASRIKAIPGAADIPIAFITAVYNEDPYVKQGYKAGGIDYLGKPFDPEILRRKLSHYASFRHRTALLGERERRLRDSEALLQEGRKLSATLEQLRVGVAVCDATGCIVHANDEFRAGPAQSTASPDAELLARAIAEGETCRDSIEAPGQGGSPRSIVRTASPLKDPAGRIVGAVLVVHDMTERRQAVRDLETRISRLVEAEASGDD